MREVPDELPPDPIATSSAQRHLATDGPRDSPLARRPGSAVVHRRRQRSSRADRVDAGCPPLFGGQCRARGQTSGRGRGAGGDLVRDSGTQGCARVGCRRSRWSGSARGRGGEVGRTRSLCDYGRVPVRIHRPWALRNHRGRRSSERSVGGAIGRDRALTRARGRRHHRARRHSAIVAVIRWTLRIAAKRCARCVPTSRRGPTCSW